MSELLPQFPIYIVSKGRWDSRLTYKSLDEMGIAPFVVIEEQEFDQYASVIPKERLLILDKKYQDNYDTFDLLGYQKSKGPGAARNFAWDHSIKNGHEWHWVMDDNINGFERLNKNLRVKCKSPALFKAMEDFCLRYTNVLMAGPNYSFFVPRRYKRKPYLLNTRIYSCNLIKNSCPYQWRGRYNEDTDISLRILKAGYCTIQFNAFLQKKVRTQVLKGGNTDAFYAKEGTYPKSKMLCEMHPDVSKLVMKYGRWHHHVDYSPFEKNRPILRNDLTIKEGINNYSMEFKEALDS